MSENESEPDGFTAQMVADIQGSVQHHAPCVPECPVCYPEGEAR